MPKELQESSVQPRKKSKITPMGGHPASNIPLRISSKGSLSFLIASMKGAHRSSEGRSTVFSTPSGPLNSRKWYYRNRDFWVFRDFRMDAWKIFRGGDDDDLDTAAS